MPELVPAQRNDAGTWHGIASGDALPTAELTDPDGNITGHNLDIQRPAGDWNFQGGFATGEPYQGGPVGSGADSTRIPFDIGKRQSDRPGPRAIPIFRWSS